MREIFEQIGDVALTGLAAALLIAIVTGIGGLSLIGSRMKTEPVNMDTYQDAIRIKTSCERENPSIRYDGQKHWKTGQELPIKEMFFGKDADGNETVIKILNITNSLGESRMEAYKESENTVLFQAPGVYNFKLQTTDEQKKRTACEISIAVDQS